MKITETGAFNKVVSVNPQWYYTWNPAGIPGLEYLPFFPMCWGKGTISSLAGPYQLLLGFNEPDYSS